MINASLRAQLIRIVRHPLLHFILIGAVMFLVYTVRNGANERASNQITIDAGRIRWLADTFTTQFGHPPSRPELQSMVSAFASDEMSYREALALGLDQDDTIVRRRMIQKYDFLNLDEQPDAPSDATLARYYNINQARYRDAPTTSFCQVYVVAIPDRGAALARVRELAIALGEGRVAPETAGDPIDVRTCFEDADRETLRRDFGAFFADTIGKLPVGRWVAPVESGYGLHAVRIAARRPRALPSFEARRAEVLADWRRDERARVRTERLADLRRRYAVTVDAAALDSTTAATR